MFQIFNGNKGASIIEILLVITILGLVTSALFGLADLSLKIIILSKQTLQGNSIAQEAMEATRNFRDGTNWGSGLALLASGIAYHPEKSADISPRWTLVQGEEAVGIFTRKIIIGDVQRDGNDNIVESGGLSDPNTKKITVTVAWQEKGRVHQMKLVTYLTNWQK